MAIVMNMSSYEVERDVSMGTEYGDENECTGYYPAIPSAYMEQTSVTERRPEMPAELAEVDVEQFLQKMYTWLS